ncbi:protein of unknown function [Sulfurivirga caldicuralii]|uniref:DUF4390 domain-containing protein n=1 Tax=Sulfurivirga caldicuralii TaxID=364032 RepID=A0A1N6DIN2_9GAMM|nr:DUF4390 domain-containing protein [Sulfurivirga caldicuralii]SIN70630.1 protein of unknown function [Sulfurivirga caldicuralii]
MRCCKKRPEWLTLLLTVLLGFTPLPSSANDAAPSVTMLFLHHYVEDETVLADLRLRPRLSTAMLDALTHAIPLFFETRLRLVEHTRLSGLIPLQRTISETRFSLRLDYLPEKRQWRLLNIDSGRVRHDDLLDEALETLGTYTGIPVASMTQLHPGIAYTIEARFRLNRNRLPAPLWLKSLGDRNWQLDSGWYRTNVDPRKLWQR